MSVKLNTPLVNTRSHPNQPVRPGTLNVGPDPKKVLDGGNPENNPSLGNVGIASGPKPPELSAKVKPFGRQDGCEDGSDPDNCPEERRPKSKVS